MSAFAPLPELPKVRGSYAYDAPLAPYLWFRAGGAAQVLFRPADADDLAAFLRHKPGDLPVTIIGVGSNLLVRDGGIAGAVIRLPAALGKVAAEGLHIRAGAAALDSAVAKPAAEHGIAGLEFLRGIPGTIGGALYMNAGCYGREVKDIFVSASAITPQGERVTLSPADMGFSYRHTALPEGTVFVEAVFEGAADDPAAIAARMDKMMQEREAAQPASARTGGSTFKNPPGHKAWELIEQAGCRGLIRGSAQVSEKHCNFLINLGTATAADIEGLGEDVREKVGAKFGIELEWEIKRVGVP
jgi:UDP-N-acetylmuramate dehydrogenase